MKYNNIEFVCAGNNGRSPIAEAAGISAARSFSCEKIVKISSSGTMADFSKIPDLRAATRPFVEKAISNGLIGKDRLKMLEQDPQRVLQELVEIEAGWRNKYILDNFNMFYYSSHVRRQTIVRPEARLILPVDKKVLEGVRSIYDDPNNLNPRPTIVLLPEFAEVDFDLSSENLSSYKEYRESAKKIEKSARLAVLKALRD